jgi:uncharacterized protein
MGPLRASPPASEETDPDTSVAHYGQPESSATLKVISGRRDRPSPAMSNTVSDGADLGSISQFVVKVHARCNLACDYCYVYQMADQGWRAQPRFMSREMVSTIAKRIARHAGKHALSKVFVVLHGGEPLLAGAAFIGFVATELRTALHAVAEVEISLQTNGVLLTPAILDVLVEHRIGVSVSVDGAEADHDRHRRHHGGKGSFGEVARGLSYLNLPAYRQVYRGLLCTVNIDNDPIDTFEALIEFAPPRIDFLLPHGNWVAPPPGRLRDGGAVAYAEWLSTAFDYWYSAKTPTTDIRFFREIIHLLFGGASRVETIGLTPSSVLVVETDGSIEQVDALKSAYDGAAATGLHVSRDDFDSALRHDAIAARRKGIEGLADSCRSCRLVKVCGGGYYPHRYAENPEPGFANPSVYCPDLMALIDHIRDRIQTDLSGVRGRQ